MADTPEQLARRLEAVMNYPDEIHVHVATSWKSGLCLPNDDGDDVDVGSALRCILSAD